MLSSISFLPVLATANGADYEMAMVIYKSLLPYALLFSTVGLAVGVFLAKSDPMGIALAILIAGATAATLAGFPEGVQKLQKSFQAKSEEISAKTDDFNSIWNTDIEEPSSIEGFLKAIINGICWICYKALQSLGLFGRRVLEWIQPYALNCMIAMAPITICMFQIPPLRGISVNTLMTTFGILLWPIGMNFADIFVAKTGLLVFSMFGIAGGAKAGLAVGSGVAAGTVTTAASAAAVAWPAILGAFLIMAIFMNILYLSVPLGIAAILRGASPAFAAAGTAAFMTASAMPMARSMSQLSQSLGNLAKQLSGKLGASAEAGADASGGGDASSGLSTRSAGKGDAWFPATPAGGGGGGGSGGGRKSRPAPPLDGPIIDGDFIDVQSKADDFASKRNALLQKNGVLALDYKHNAALEQN